MEDFFKNKITLENKAEIETFVNTYPHETSGLSFTSLYMWRNQNMFTYEIIDDFLCVAGFSNFEGFQDEPFVFPPLPRYGDCTDKNLKGVIEKIIARFNEYGSPFVMRLIPEHMKKRYSSTMPGKFLMLDDRANYDYVYKIEDLVNLSGRKYHGKKNHLNKFNKLYEGRYEVRPMSAEYREEALKLLAYIDVKKQVEGFDHDMLMMEAEVLEDILPKYDELCFRGCALFIDGGLQAYAFGGPLGDGTIVEHIEKANIDYEGIYQKINNEFCRMMQGQFEFVNREEDMGLEGLRKSKTSYKPFKMIEKSIMMLADDKEAIRRYSF